MDHYIIIFIIIVLFVKISDCLLCPKRKFVFYQTSCSQQKILFATTTATTATNLYTTTSPHADIESYPSSISSSSSSSSSNIGDNRFKSNSLEAATWNLLNETKIGEFGRIHFQEAERIADVWKHRQTKRAAITLERLLRRIVEEQIVGNPYADEVDTTKLYTDLIEAWAKSGEYTTGGPERAEEILDYYHKIYDDGDSYDPLLCEPNLESWNTVIASYAESGRIDAPQQAVRVLGKLYDLIHHGKTTITPSKETYAHVLRAWSKAGTEESPKIVRRLLEHMEELAQKYPSVKPDYHCHNVYIDALIEAMSTKSISGMEAVKLAEEYLNWMMDNPDDDVKPDKWTFNLYLTILGRSKLYDIKADLAEKLLARMETYHEQCGYSIKTQPNTNTYNSVMSCYATIGNHVGEKKALALLEKMKKLSEGGNISARPTSISYNIAMNAIVKSKRPDAPLKVEALLREMNKLYLETDDISLRPNRRSINTCLDAWAKSNLEGADERIMEWIKTMRQGKNNGINRLSPDTWSYNHYLTALSKSRKSQIGEIAENILKEMEESYNQGQVRIKPNVMTFTSVINCIAKSGQDNAVERAIAVLDRMEELHSNGFGDVRPNLFTYNSVINTVAKSKKFGKADLALKLLKRVKSVALRPGCVTYNSVINACAFSDIEKCDPDKMLSIALNVLKEAQSGPGANWVTYQTILRVISKFMKDSVEKGELVHDLVRQCCKDGQLTRTVLSQVKFAVSSFEKYQLIEKEVYDPNTKTLKSEYTKNAEKSIQEGSTKISNQ